MEPFLIGASGNPVIGKGGVVSTLCPCMYPVIFVFFLFLHFQFLGYCIVQKCFNHVTFLLGGWSCVPWIITNGNHTVFVIFFSFCCHAWPTTSRGRCDVWPTTASTEWERRDLPESLARFSLFISLFLISCTTTPPFNFTVSTLSHPTHLLHRSFSSPFISLYLYRFLLVLSRIWTWCLPQRQRPGRSANGTDNVFFFWGHVNQHSLILFQPPASHSPVSLNLYRVFFGGGGGAVFVTHFHFLFFVVLSLEMVQLSDFGPSWLEVRSPKHHEWEPYWTGRPVCSLIFFSISSRDTPNSSTTIHHPLCSLPLLVSLSVICKKKSSCAFRQFTVYA